jgi:hypothetical protein
LATPSDRATVWETIALSPDKAIDYESVDGNPTTDAKLGVPMTRRRSKIIFGCFWSVVVLAWIALLFVNAKVRHSWLLWVFCCVYALIFVNAFARARCRWLLPNI